MLKGDGRSWKFELGKNLSHLTCPMRLNFDYLSEQDLPDAIEIERQGYPPDEAASLEAFQLRQSQAGQLFLGVYVSQEPSGRRLIGYVCSTLSHAETLTHHSMSEHVPGAPSVCIHSVCVATAYRRQGVALSLLQEYITRLRTSSDRYERVLLIAHEELIPFYRKAGFDLVGPSPVVHGSQPWYEMGLSLGARNPNSQDTGAVPLSALRTGLAEVTITSKQTNN